MRTVNPLVPTQPVVDGLRQGEGRSRRTGGAALDPGTAAQPAVNGGRNLPKRWSDPCGVDRFKPLL
jgi:hypothetical protein